MILNIMYMTYIFSLIAYCALLCYVVFLFAHVACLYLSLGLSVAFMKKTHDPWDPQILMIYIHNCVVTVSLLRHSSMFSKDFAILLVLNYLRLH